MLNVSLIGDCQQGKFVFPPTLGCKDCPQTNLTIESKGDLGHTSYLNRQVI